MGTAILTGLLAHLAKLRSGASASTSGKTVNEDSSTPHVSVHAINACVRTSRSASRLRKTALAFSFPIDVSYGTNLTAVQPADIVLLACLPEQAKDCLGVPGMADALRGKILISVLAGVSEAKLGEFITGSGKIETCNGDVVERSEPSALCTIVRAMPNTAAMAHEGITIIAEQDLPIPAHTMMLVEWLFALIGTVARITARHLDAGTSLCSSGPAFVAKFIEGLVDGAVGLGLRRPDAVAMAAQMVKGTACLILGGRSLPDVMEEIATPGGSTMVGLLTLEEGRVKATAARAIMESTRALDRMTSG